MMKFGAQTVLALYRGSTLITDMKLGSTTVDVTPVQSTVGRPIGLLLALTKAS